jgi:uncharacterized membrane protein YqjE
VFNWIIKLLNSKPYYYIILLETHSTLRNVESHDHDVSLVSCSIYTKVALILVKILIYSPLLIVISYWSEELWLTVSVCVFNWWNLDFEQWLIWSSNLSLPILCPHLRLENFLPLCSPISVTNSELDTLHNSSAIEVTNKPYRFS